MSCRVAHFEIHADDPERAAEFYSSIFGWDIKKWDPPSPEATEGQEVTPKMEYWMVMTGEKDEPGGINGGLLRRPGSAPAVGQCNNAYVCTIVVPSFDEYAEKIIAKGGKVAMPKFALVGMAWQGYFIDTEGNTFGLHQIDEKAA